MYFSTIRNIYIDIYEKYHEPLLFSYKCVNFIVNH